ncbi:MAG: hypothetical protein KAS39_01830, partial [Actinomycetia bacterium]|nr:hypothetical protein [Actinomycetes bacterium]
MFRSKKICKIDIIVLKNAVNRIIDRFGEDGIIEFIETDSMKISVQTDDEKEMIKENRERFEKIRVIFDMFEKLKADHGIEFNEKTDTFNLKMDVRNGEGASDLDEIILKLENIHEHIEVKKQRKSVIKDYLLTVASFTNIDVPIEKFEDLTYLYIKIGRMKSERVKGLTDRYSFPYSVLPLSDSENYIFITSRKNMFRLNDILKKNYFKPVDFKGMKGIPSKIKNEMETELRDIMLELDLLIDKITHYYRRYYPVLQQELNSIRKNFKIEDVKVAFLFTEKTCHLSGWIIKDKLPDVKEILTEMEGQHFIVSCTDPEDIPDVSSGKLKVPTKFSNLRFFKPFESLVKNFGSPSYGEIEPTPVFAVLFILLFGTMFGDIGHGFVLIILGIILMFKEKKQLGTIITACGSSSVIFGILYGSVFGNEHVFTAVWLNPMEQKNILFFLGVIVIGGIIIISIGLFFSLLNALFRRDIKAGIFNKTGLAGAWFYWGSLYLAFRKFVQKSELSLFLI